MNNYIKLLYDNTKINKNKIKKEWIEKNIPEYFKILLDFQEKMNFKFLKYSQLIFHYENNMIDYPKCEYCGFPNKRFVGFESGYKSGCSKHCAILLSRPQGNEQRRKNTLDKYGVVHSTQRKEVQEKMKKTNLEKFGTEFAAQNLKIKEKIKETNKIKYGCELPLQNKEIKDKMISNFIEKWGYDNPIKSPIIINKIKENSLIKYGTEWHISSDKVKLKIKESQKNLLFSKIKEKYGEYFNILSYENNIIKIKCNKCNNEFLISSSLLYQRYLKHEIEVCLNCNPLNNHTSNGHLEIVEFLNELNISDLIINCRNIINPFELDIYLPEYNMAIEFNGIYWHSELQKNKSYHFDKYKMCRDKGVQLIQIWEDDWNYKKDIIKSIIKNKLRRNNISIGARKCEIKKVSNKESMQFLNENHIQGWCISKYRYGLYYNHELISLMTFSNSRKNMNGKNGVFEVTRFCNKIGLNIIGSMSRLWKMFIKDVIPKNIISYSDNDFFNGESYSQLGMKYESESMNYWWCDGKRRYNRWSFRKDKLVKEGYDKNLSEAQIMLSRGWFRCYGSGNKKFIWTK